MMQCSVSGPKASRNEPTGARRVNESSASNGSRVQKKTACSKQIRRAPKNDRKECRGPCFESSSDTGLQASGNASASIFDRLLVDFGEPSWGAKWTKHRTVIHAKIAMAQGRGGGVDAACGRKRKEERRKLYFSIVPQGIHT